MDTAGARLRAARLKAGFTSARAAALAMDIPVSTYNSHERSGEPGARGFGPDEASIYARRFGVSAGWLLTGEGHSGTSIALVSWVSAGNMQIAGDTQDPLGAPHLEMADLPPGDWIALRVEGDSMNRISPPDSIIFVNCREKRLVSNACYIITSDEGEATYKRFRPDPMRFEPVSTNPIHETIYTDAKPNIIGRVRRTMLDM